MTAPEPVKVGPFSLEVVPVTMWVFLVDGREASRSTRVEDAVALRDAYVQNFKSWITEHAKACGTHSED